MQDRGYQVVGVYREVASGLSENRRKLTQALKRFENREADILIVEFKDRLTRFGFNCLVRLLKATAGAR